MLIGENAGAVVQTAHPRNGIDYLISEWRGKIFVVLREELTNRAERANLGSNGALGQAFSIGASCYLLAKLAAHYLKQLHKNLRLCSETKDGSSSQERPP